VTASLDDFCTRITEEITSRNLYMQVLFTEWETGSIATQPQFNVVVRRLWCVQDFSGCHCLLSP
jgi:hypothetical protein